MAHKKAAGSAKNLRDSNPKYRGVKILGGQTAVAGNIVVRQKGDKYLPGHNTYKGKDFTIHAGIDGVVHYRKKYTVRYDGRKYLKTVIDIVPVGEEPQVAALKKPSQQVTAKAKPAKVPAAKKAPVAKTAKPTKAPATKKEAPVAASADDLTSIKGLGPKTAEVLAAAGITSFQGLADAGEEKLKDIFAAAGGRLASTDPAPWIAEAKAMLK
ncbi:MAG: 50S ribosomal protein L27 [Candidatus Peribacteria bacterium]|nr:MAG: 50S ribosomal protein L27 [Candidatus Peribacteria bacterium]